MNLNYAAKTFLTFHFLTFIFSTIYAQSEHMNWHFGNGVGLNFSSGTPTTFSGSAIETSESCYTVNDAAGNILFYTNGIKVWDATNTVMPNGSDLFGNESSQCIVLPKPDNPNRYFIVSTDARRFDGTTPHGLVYSEVDMTLNGGLGDVIASEKNIVLTPHSGEWITAIPHANCSDTWIITHGNKDHSLLMAFQLTNTGISLIPVESDLGIVYGELDAPVGILRPHPEGEIVAMSRPLTWPDSKLDLFDFDNNTGIGSGFTNIYTETGINRPFGLEFSRSGDLLYVGQTSHSKIFQYDMLSADIPASRTLVGELTTAGEIGQLQIAPNDKIYVNYNIFPSGGNFLGVINSPETLGVGCGFNQNAVSLGAVVTIYGLPWYYSPHVNSDFSLDLGADTSLCQGEELLLSPTSTGPTGTTYEWSTGSTDETINISDAGTYWVSAQTGACPAITDSITILIDETEVHALINDTAGCGPLTVHLSAEESGGISKWMWDMGDGTFLNTQVATYTYAEPGNYVISLSAISEANCLVKDSLSGEINVFESPAANFTIIPSMVVLDEPVLLEDNSSGSVISWEWENQNQVISTNPDYEFIPENIENNEYTLIVTNDLGCSDEVTKTISFEAEDFIYIPNAFTPNGDGSNDVFKVVDYFELVSEILIYDRWGELIWHSTTSNETWNGSYNGVIAPDGVYIYKVRAEIEGLQQEVSVGHVVLIR